MPQPLKPIHIPQSSLAQKGDGNEQNNQSSYLSHSNKSSGKKSPWEKEPHKRELRWWGGGGGGTGILNRVVKEGLAMH